MLKEVTSINVSIEKEIQQTRELKACVAWAVFSSTAPVPMHSTTEYIHSKALGRDRWNRNLKMGCHHLEFEPELIMEI